MSSRRNHLQNNMSVPEHYLGDRTRNGTPLGHRTGLSRPMHVQHTAYPVNAAPVQPEYYNGGYYMQPGYSPSHPYNGVAHHRTGVASAPYSSMQTMSPVELSLPSHRETELWLRNHFKIATLELNLWRLPDITNVKRLPNLTDMIFLAIWGNPYKRLGLSEIYAAIEARYPILAQYEDKAWQRSIRHRLSLKACFVRVKRDRRGADWMIDVSKGLQNGRAYQAAATGQTTSGSSSSDSYHHSDEDTSPFLAYYSDSEGMLTPPPQPMPMPGAVQEYSLTSSNLSLHDQNEYNRMGTGYQYMG